MLDQQPSQIFGRGGKTVRTYLASATASRRTHCAAGALEGAVADEDEVPRVSSSSSGPVARFLPDAFLPLDVLGIAAPKDAKSGAGTRGGGASLVPPSSTTHCTRYVFRICENMCSTSPAGTTFTTWSDPRCSADDCEVERRAAWPRDVTAVVDCAGGGATSRADRSELASSTCAEDGDEERSGTFGAVGNSCKPARSPVFAEGCSVLGKRSTG